MSIWSDRGLLIYCCVMAFCVGAVFGSFLNCAAWRIAHGESCLGGHSRCPHCGHELGAQGVGGGVEADGDVAVALLEESFQLILHAHRTDGDALGAPCPTIVGSQDVRGTEHIVEVVHWLALPHEHDVGQLVHLWQRVYLVEDVACRQTALKPLLSCLTEQAVHLAPHL